MFVIHDSPKRPSALIRRAQPADAAEIRNIALRCVIDAWTTQQYLNEIERSDAIIYVATGGSALVGFVSGRVVPSTSNGFDGEIYNVAVLPGSRRKRIGVELLRNALADFVSNQCKSIWLEVRESNQPAIQFYENNGFTTVTTRRNFYSAPVEDAIVMRLTLDLPPSLNSSPNA